MRHVVLICFLHLAIVLDATSQDTVSLKYIESRIRTLQPEGEVYYSNLPLQDYFKQFVESFTGSVKDHSGETLTLTRKEVSFLKKELRESQLLEYPDSLFFNSRRINKDTIVDFVEARNKSVYDSILNSSDKSKVQPYIKFWAFSFSRPIYIRESQLMIFYFMYFANDGGEHGLSFYKKVDGSWRPFAIVSGGAW